MFEHVAPGEFCLIVWDGRGRCDDGGIIHEQRHHQHVDESESSAQKKGQLIAAYVVTAT